MSGGVEVLPGVVLPWNRIVIIVFAAPCSSRCALLLDAHAPRPLRARRDAEPRDGRLRRRADGARRHLGVRAGLGHRRARRVRALADRQRRAGPRPGLHRRFVHGRRAGRRRASSPARSTPRSGSGFVNKLLETWQGAVIAKIVVLRLHHRLHPEAAAGAVRAQGPRGGGLTWGRSQRRSRGSTARGAGSRSARSRSCCSSSCRCSNLAVPQASAFHVSAYWVTLVGKIMCYAIVALAMDLIWGYAGILSLGHGLFFALGGYAMGMYLMRQIGARRASTGMNCPTSWCSSTGRSSPGTGGTPISFFWAMLPGRRGARAARLRVRLLRVPLAREGRVLLDHHPGADLRRDAAVLPQRRPASAATTASPTSSASSASRSRRPRRAWRCSRSPARC